MRVVEDVAERAHEWADRVVYDAEERWYERYDLDDEREVWLISWVAAQSTAFHDHGGRRGALRVVSGSVIEEIPRDGPGLRLDCTTLSAGDLSAFESDRVHDVVHHRPGPHRPRLLPSTDHDAASTTCGAMGCGRAVSSTSARTQASPWPSAEPTSPIT